MDDARYRLYEQPWPEGEHRHFQLGFVVEDVIATAGRWATVFGIGPFHVLPRIKTTCTYRGAEAELDSQIAVAQEGPVQIELIQPFGDAPNVYTDLVDKGACRFHQLSTLTDDYAGTTAHYRALGFEIVCEIDARGQHVAYVDTIADFGFFTEVVERVPGFVESVAAIARTCAEWDGHTDPVRLLTRDGYRTP
jgi:hypothetical protein